MQGLYPAAARRPALTVFARLIRTSGTWTAPASGWATFIAAGPSGSGAVAVASGATATRATGGAAGGWCLKQAYVTAGAAYTITIGLGGPAASRTTPGASNGSAGTAATTVSGPGVSLSAGPGLGGVASTTDGAAVAASAGGTSTGGDINCDGGPSGSIAAISFAGPISTGGGALNPQGRASTRGGNVASVAGSQAYATGAGSVGGDGGDITSGQGNAASGGGGADGSANVNSGGAAPLLATAGLYLGLMSFVGAGTNAGSAAAITDWGASSAGLTGNASSPYISGVVAFGATGATAAVNSTDVRSAAPTLGGGSGGVAASLVGASGTFNSGKGADGFVWVIFHGGDR